MRLFAFFVKVICLLFQMLQNDFFTTVITTLTLDMNPWSEKQIAPKISIGFCRDH